MLIFNVFTRVFVLVFGVGLQIATAVYAPALLRSVQKGAGVMGEAIADTLPDAFAVWTGVIGLSGLLVHLIFILVAIIIVEVIKQSLPRSSKD